MLSSTKSKERKKMLAILQSSLRQNNIEDLSDLSQNWSVVEINGAFVISNGKETLSGVSSKDRSLIESLYNEAARNYGR